MTGLEWLWQRVHVEGADPGRAIMELLAAHLASDIRRQAELARDLDRWSADGGR